MRKLALVAACACALSACGGGGGSGGGRGGSWLAVEPARIAMEVYQGDPVEFGIVAKQVAGVDPGDGVLNVGLVQSAEVVQPAYEIIRVSDADFSAKLHLRTDLPPGVHEGTFELRLCHDADIVTCARPWPGSPWVIPFTFTVRAGSDLRPLTRLAGAGPWSTFGGNAAHTGYVPAPALDGESIGRRWGWVSGRRISGVAVEGGRVFVVSSSLASSAGMEAYTLHAIRESDGQVDWSKDLGNSDHVSAPAAADGRVYVTKSGVALYAFDQATGEELAAEPLEAQWEKAGQPEIFGHTVFTVAGHVPGIVSYDAVTDEVSWSTPCSGMEEETWTPTADGQYVYGLASEELVVLRALDGSLVARVDDPEPAGRSFWFGTGGGVVLGPDGVAYNTYIDGANGDDVAGGRLVSYAVGTDAPARRWSIAGTFRSAPVLANGVLYVINGDSLDARSPDTGDLQWSWAPEGGLQAFTNTARYLAVVGNKAIVDGGDYTFIVDLTTRQAEFAQLAGGPVAVSDNGVAYISGRNGVLVAVNLQ